jgi:hypothetical protein
LNIQDYVPFSFSVFSETNIEETKSEIIFIQQFNKN